MIEVKIAKLGIDATSKMPVIILKEKEGEKRHSYSDSEVLSQVKNDLQPGWT